MRTTAEFLRDIIKDEIAEGIEFRRESMVYSVDEPLPSFLISPNEAPTEDEVDDFILSNPLFENEVHEILLDSDLLGYEAKVIEINKKWLKDFKENVKDWASNQGWIAGDDAWFPIIVGTDENGNVIGERVNLHEKYFNPEKSKIWTPSIESTPLWVESSPSYLMIAQELLRQGKSLSELRPRDFEYLIGDLLESDGWDVLVTKQSKDGGIDVIAVREDSIIGAIKTIWQAKKYSGKNYVKLHEVRELWAVRELSKASKSFIVTTSRLTRDAIDFIKQDEFRMGYVEGLKLNDWVLKINKK